MKNKKSVISELSITNLLQERDTWISNFIKHLKEASIGSFLFYFSRENELFVDYIKNSRLFLDFSGKLFNVYSFKSVYKDIFNKMDPIFRADFNSFVNQLDEFSFGYIKSSDWEQENGIDNDIDRWKVFRSKLAEINKRDELMACVLFATKISAEAICRIKIENFNAVGSFFIFPKKNRDFKVIPIPKTLSLRIHEYIKNKKIESPYIFSTNQGNPTTRSRITFAFNEVAKRNPFLSEPKITPKYLKSLYKSIHLMGVDINHLV